LKLYISVFYFARNHASETEMELFQPPKDFWKHFKIIAATQFVTCRKIFNTSCNKPPK